ncbi:hypothetical protein JGI12_01111 [Candidatus Kryptonium thompsonii]|nr:hypothetical protein JGI12_01111 [Candidatus Kryptonium thompsoni]
MKVGVIGLGYWGPNLVRNFYQRQGLKEYMAVILMKSDWLLLSQDFQRLK